MFIGLQLCNTVVLVRVFQRLIRAWRAQHSNGNPSWRILVALLRRLHGIDKQPDAVRIAVFSLYIALLEEVEPPAIAELLRTGRILPPLFGKTLLNKDFFDPKSKIGKYDLIIGNPPWVSRNVSAVKSALTWCEGHNRPMPQKEVAWGFIWKVQAHTRRTAVVALLLPAMGILHNHTDGAQEARRLWLQDATLLRVVNFSDVCFQLFDGANRPTILAIFVPRCTPAYEFDYWCPKATRVLSSAKILVLSPVDQWKIDSHTATSEPFFWKRRMWAGGRELRVLAWLLDLPKLEKFVSSYRARGGSNLEGDGDRWTIGQGFQELREDLAKGAQHGYAVERRLTKIPFLDTAQFQPWVIPTIDSKPWPTPTVRRAGYVQGYFGPRILVIKGVQRQTGLIRAAYVEQDFSFRHSIQAITFPPQEKQKAKLLTAILNSNLASWFLFHISGSFGTERAEVHIEELLQLPFVDPPANKSAVAEEIISIIDGLFVERNHVLLQDITPQIRKANNLVYEYFGMTADESAIIEEGVGKVIPSMQPRRRANTPLLREASSEQASAYARTLVTSLERWVERGTRLQATVFADAFPWLAVQLRFVTGTTEPVVVTQGSAPLRDAIHHFMASLPPHQSRNGYAVSSVKAFVGDTLTLVKPSDSRFWLHTTALNDADEIAGDLLLERHRLALGQTR